MTSPTFPEIFHNFFLVHDFFQKLCKLPPANPDFSDLQFDIQQSVKKGAKRGAYTFQIILAGGFVTYCLKGNNKFFKIIAGVLYVRWLHHFYTMGSYGGVLLRLPSICKRTQSYFKSHTNQKNYLQSLKQELGKYDDSEIDIALHKIFPKEIKQDESFVQNTFYQRNKEYFFAEFGKGQTASDTVNQQGPQKLRLKYLDSFITRYIYYSFSRWLVDVKKTLGV